jgi:hypothetical protein
MDNICLGAFSTKEEAENALVTRTESVETLSIIEDGSEEFPFRIWWIRSF